VPSLILIAFFSFLLAAPARAGEVEPRLRSSLRSLGASDHVPVIIHLSEKASADGIQGRDGRERRSKIIRSLRETAERSQALLGAHLKVRNAKRVRPLWVVNAVAATVEAGQVAELAALPGVDRVVLDATVHAPELSAGTHAAPEWNLTAIGAPDLWNRGFTGQGAVVANMDTGVDLDHPDLQTRWRGGTNSWFDPHNEHPLSPYDSLGHGTQTMGIMVAGDAGGSVVGVAPGAQWIAVKLFDDAGDTTYSIIHQSFQWLLDPDGDPGTDDAPDVVNHSWGLIDPAHGCVTEFQPDVQVLKAAGIAMAFSAGNDGPASSTGNSPANYPESFSVGAVDSAGIVAAFSSRGPSACYGDNFPVVVAPGVSVRTTDLYLGIPGAAYASVEGTSFAAPHVAGAMALLRSAFPGLDVPKLERALARSATDLGTTGPDNDSGNGLLDVNGVYLLLRRHDIGVFRDGRWLRDVTENMAWDAGADSIATFGRAGDVPVSGDWNGDGITEIGVFRSSGTWYLDLNGNGAWDPGIDSGFRFGITGDVPVTGDWNNDGITDVGVFRGNGYWYLDTNGNHAWNGGVDATFKFGMTGDVPVTGDWNGDGITDIGVFRGNGSWYLDLNGSRAWDEGDSVFKFGITGDIPVTGDWNSDGTDDLGVFRANGSWYLDANGSRTWNAGDLNFKFGVAGDVPVAGRW
jgi:bacillopeptidase F